jgi:hypothetical protein
LIEDLQERLEELKEELAKGKRASRILKLKLFWARLSLAFFCMTMTVGFLFTGCVLFVLEVTIGPARAKRAARWFFRRLGIPVDDDE